MAFDCYRTVPRCDLVHAMLLRRYTADSAACRAHLGLTGRKGQYLTLAEHVHPQHRDIDRCVEAQGYLGLPHHPRRPLKEQPGGEVMFTSMDYDKFRALRVATGSRNSSKTRQMTLLPGAAVPHRRRRRLRIPTGKQSRQTQSPGRPPDSHSDRRRGRLQRRVRHHPGENAPLRRPRLADRSDEPAHWHQSPPQLNGSFGI